MAPAQQRRKNGQNDLREASEIASQLVKSDLESVASTRAREVGCTEAKTELQRKAVENIQSLIIENGNRTSSSNRTKLKALLDESPDVTRIFLPNGFKEGKEGWLCVHLAASVGNQEAFESIYDHDPECAELSTEDGKTPAHLAAIGMHLGVARSIVGRTAQNCRLQDAEGNLPLHLVLGPKWRENKLSPLITSTLLVGYPSGMSVMHPMGEYPIHFAAKSGFCAGIRGILSADIRNVYRRSKDGYTPVDLAIEEHAKLSKRLQTMYQGGCRSKKRNTRSKDLPKGHNEQDEGNENVLKNDDITEIELIERKSQYEECIEVLLMSAFYCMPIFLPRDTNHADNADAPFFLPLHAALFNRLRKESWMHLITMFGKMHAHDIDQDGQTLLHAIADCGSNKERQLEELEVYSDVEIIAMIKQIHVWNPKAHEQRDHLGRLPLHLSILIGVSAPVVQEILQCGMKTMEVPWVSPLQLTAETNVKKTGLLC